jgi:hypothetical protein
MADTQPGKHPVTGKPQGKLKKGPGENKVGGKKGKPPLISEETKAYAAFLIADNKSAAEVAKQCDISERTLWAWRKEEWFLDLVSEALEKIRSEGTIRGFSEREARVQALNNLANDFLTVFKERGEEAAHIAVPGWRTGLMVHEQKSIGAGPLASVHDLYRVDVPTTKEFRETLKQIAIEVGQWTEKSETSFDFSKLSDEQLTNLEDAVSKLTA